MTIFPCHKIHVYPTYPTSIITIHLKIAWWGVCPLQAFTRTFNQQLKYNFFIKLSLPYHTRGEGGEGAGLQERGHVELEFKTILKVFKSTPHPHPPQLKVCARPCRYFLIYSVFVFIGQNLFVYETYIATTPMRSRVAIINSL